MSRKSAENRKVSIDEYQGEFEGRLVSANIHYILVDYCDTYPFKYVFSYQFITSRPCFQRWDTLEIILDNIK